MNKTEKEKKDEPFNNINKLYREGKIDSIEASALWNIELMKIEMDEWEHKEKDPKDNKFSSSWRFD